MCESLHLCLWTGSGLLLQLVQCLVDMPLSLTVGSLTTFVKEPPSTSSVSLDTRQQSVTSYAPACMRQTRNRNTRSENATASLNVVCCCFEMLKYGNS